MSDEYDASADGERTPMSSLIAEYIPDYIEPVEIDPNDGISRYDDYRGKAKMLVFNHTEFKNNRVKQRAGTENDGISLKKTFKRMGFEVATFKDKTEKEIFTELECVTDDLKCIAIVVLSHGSNRKIEAFDKDYDEKKLLKYFKDNNRFVGIPKLFIFQICRENSMTRDDMQPSLQLQLEDKDMIVLHSTYFGEYSHRNTEKGAWFIQTLCKRLDEMKKENLLLDEMTFIMRDVAIHYNGGQMPIVSYNIKKRFFLSPTETTDSRLED